MIGGSFHQHPEARNGCLWRTSDAANALEPKQQSHGWRRFHDDREARNGMLLHRLPLADK